VALSINMVVAIVLVVSSKVGGFDDFVELDEFLYILIFFWFLMTGPGRVSVDTLINRWLRVDPKSEARSSAARGSSWPAADFFRP
jgi:putative oxidoreductase